MTWTYDPTALATTPLYQVRALTGDVDVTDPQLPDEQISFLLLPSQFGNVPRAAMQACRNIAALYARQVNKAVGSMRLDADQRQKHYLELARQIEMQYVISGVQPFAGGISLSDKQARSDDSDRVPPYFTRTVDAIPGASPGGDAAAENTTDDEDAP